LLNGFLVSRAFGIDSASPAVPSRSQPRATLGFPVLSGFFPTHPTDSSLYAKDKTSSHGSVALHPLRLYVASLCFARFLRGQCWVPTTALSLAS